MVVYLQVKGGIGDVFDDEAHFAESLDDKVTLVLGGVSEVLGEKKEKRVVEGETYAEVTLEMDHFVLDELGLQERDGGVLEGMGGTTVKVLGLLAWLRWVKWDTYRTARANALDC